MSKEQLTVFYAHCMSIYNTPQEKRDIELLHKLGFLVLNPNSPEHDKKYKQIGMEYSVDLLEFCDILVFRGLPCGLISSGVFKEIGYAKEIRMPIFELPCSILRREMSSSQTREYLHECGQR